jgi:outer membrane receptor protein involved in Fe transport
VDVSGGLEDVQYYVSGNWDRDEGVVPSNVAEKFRARANLTFRPHSSLDINASLGVTTGRTDTYGFQYFFNTRYWFPLLFQLDAPNQGFLSVPPDVQLKTQDVFQDLDRFTGGVQVNHRPTTWFSHRLALGLDLTNQEDVYLIPFVPDEFAAVYSPTARLGSKSVDGTEAEFNTVDYSGTFTLPLAGGLRSNTSIGGQLYRSFLKVEELAGQEFPAPGVTAIAAITGPTQVSEDQVENTTVGLYVQQQFSWNERLFLTGAVRMDDNSAFGADFDVVAYPKVSASWVVSEEPFWRVPWLHDLRLRAAYGESGQQPNAFAAIRTYQPIAGRDDRPSGSPQFVGNPDLGPERGREIEAGFDAGLLGDRIGVEFTYYYKRTDDAIVSRAVAPSTGFPATQFVNAGEVTNKGFELLLRGRPFDTRVLDWELTLNLSHNDNEVTSLALAGVPFIGVGFIPNRHQPGFPVASYFGKKIVSAELDADGNAVNILCDGGSPRGKLALDGTPLEAGGPAVDCLGAPDLYLGPNVPHTEGSVASTITLFDRLRFYALLDFKLGRKYFSSDKALLCSVFRTHEINFFPERFDPIDVATCQVSVTGFFDDGFILDADFAKLRELSLNYALPDRWAARLGASRASITVAARNVYTWRPGGPFDTTDPEVFTPVNYASSNHNQGIVPLPVQFLTTVNLTF